MMGSVGAVGTVLTACTYAGEWQEQLLMVKSPGNPREPGGEAGGATSTTAVVGCSASALGTPRKGFETS